MSEIFVASSLKPKSKRNLDSFMRRILWITIVVLLLFSVGEMVFYFFVAPNVLIRKIEIKSALDLTEQEVLDLAGINGSEYYFSVNLEAIEARLKTSPLVRDAIVEKNFPDTLRLTLVGRTPLLVAYARENGSTVPVVFDEEGILFQRGEKITERNIPVLSGVKLGEIRQGAALSKLISPFLKDLGELKRKNPELYDLISEIRVVSTESGGYELVLYPLSYRLRVWIGKRINAGMIRYLFFALNFIEQEGILKKIDEADFRTGELVYKAP